MIAGAKPANGQVKKGYSIPESAREDRTLVFGASSYHGGDFVNLKDLLQNKYLKESLVQKIQDELTQDILNSRVSEARDWRNKAFEYRKNSSTLKIQELEANHWTNNSPLKSHRANSELVTSARLKTFDKRSKSVLPPINTR